MSGIIPGSSRGQYENLNPASAAAAPRKAKAKGASLPDPSFDSDKLAQSVRTNSNPELRVKPPRANTSGSGLSRSSNNLPALAIRSSSPRSPRLLQKAPVPPVSSYIRKSSESKVNEFKDYPTFDKVETHALIRHHKADIKEIVKKLTMDSFKKDRLYKDAMIDHIRRELHDVEWQIEGHKLFLKESIAEAIVAKRSKTSAVDSHELTIESLLYIQQKYRKLIDKISALKA